LEAKDDVMDTWRTKNPRGHLVEELEIGERRRELVGVFANL
jgi:hypothetical protein